VEASSVGQHQITRCDASGSAHPIDTQKATDPPEQRGYPTELNEYQMRQNTLNQGKTWKATEPARTKDNAPELIDLLTES
jgi:hypothetical protein